jgi:hypothetical protein
VILIYEAPKLCMCDPDMLRFVIVYLYSKFVIIWTILGIYIAIWCVGLVHLAYCRGLCQIGSA